MIQLDSIIFSDVLWTDRRAWTGVDARKSSTLTGRSIIWEQAIDGGQPITLSGGIDWGWITAGNLDDLYELAKIPGAYYELSYEGDLYTVRFRQEEPPVIDAVPVTGRPNEASTDQYCNLTIKLMVV